jgi:VIT1/CCC1 family predicted Fe2+/Mn2+ transporter
MKSKTGIALVIVGLCALALLVAVIARPQHWDRTAIAAVVLGAVAAAFAYRSTRIA